MNKEQTQSIASVFQKMMAEQDSAYAYKDELIRSYLSLIIHEALKLQPTVDVTQNKNAAVRITSVFLELLERQFPIESTERPLALRTAQDFAKHLSVHVNYLNSQQTGDPAKLGQAMVTIANEEHPPLRFLAGADAVGTAEQVAATLQQQANAYRELSGSLVFN